jgi:hypothetical protein
MLLEFDDFLMGIEFYMRQQLNQALGIGKVKVPDQRLQARRLSIDFGIETPGISCGGIAPAPQNF